MKKIWKSSLSRETKVQLFKATSETILLYGSATWSLTKQEEQELNGTYTRILRMVLNIDPTAHIKNEVLYANMKKITTVIRERRMKLAGHVFRDNSSPAHITAT